MFSFFVSKIFIEITNFNASSFGFLFFIWFISIRYTVIWDSGLIYFDMGFYWNWKLWFLFKWKSKFSISDESKNAVNLCSACQESLACWLLQMYKLRKRGWTTEKKERKRERKGEKGVKVTKQYELIWVLSVLGVGVGREERKEEKDEHILPQIKSSINFKN